MFTKDDLEQIGKLLDSKLQSEREQTKKLFQDEREHTKNIVQAAKEEIIETISKETKTIAGFFQTTWQKYDDHEERFEKLEEDQISTHKN